MTGVFISLLILLIFLAAYLRDDFALTLIYLVVGAYVIGTWWARRALANVEHKHRLTDHAFLGEKIQIHLDLRNKSWLPIPWLDVRETLPVDLAGPMTFRHVTSLGPHADSHFEYSLEARKRGYYPIGPTTISSGDILGLTDSVQRVSAARYVTVYPKIVSLTSVEIPSRSPQGTLRHVQPVYEDPTRVFGKREYVAGDSLRRVDWKSTATTGRLQVKLFEPSISLETLICLNLNAEDYYYRARIDSTELGIIIAASLANWIVEKGQTVGLKVNGLDPLAPGNIPQYFSPHKGKAHLIRMLETLARVEVIKESSFAAMIQQQRYRLSWGTTLLVITGQANDALLDELYQARRAGQNAVLILAGRNESTEGDREKAAFFGIPVVSILHERDMDIWRR
ncbi:MAG TPA: DUF58 domain-containing protein [Anaerolineales bacterium]|nr:DUF58 domain-containing protein [Anaerolineales bacterium]